MVRCQSFKAHHFLTLVGPRVLLRIMWSMLQLRNTELNTCMTQCFLESAMGFKTRALPSSSYIILSVNNSECDGACRELKVKAWNLVTAHLEGQVVLLLACDKKLNGRRKWERTDEKFLIFQDRTNWPNNGNHSERGATRSMLINFNSKLCFLGH